MEQTGDTTDFLMKPKIDFAFKEIMKDEKARKGFLAAVLKIKPEDIKSTIILNTELQRVHKDEKQGILDVRISMNNDTEIDVEIQLSEIRVWADRALFYISKMYTEQIGPGDYYDKLKKCISISILNFKLFKKESSYFSCFHIREDTRNTLFTDKMEFCVIELPKLPAELKEGNYDDTLLWAKFIDAEQREEFEMLASKNTYIESAYKQLQVISQNKDKRREYEDRQKAIRDYNQGIYEAEQRGWEDGKKAGWEDGKKAGWEDGKRDNSIQIAKDMLKDNLSIETISKYTKLSPQEVEALCTRE